MTTKIEQGPSSIYYSYQEEITSITTYSGNSAIKQIVFGSRESWAQHASYVCILHSYILIEADRNLDSLWLVSSSNYGLKPGQDHCGKEAGDHSESSTDQPPGCYQPSWAWHLKCPPPVLIRLTNPIQPGIVCPGLYVVWLDKSVCVVTSLHFTFIYYSIMR